MKNITKMKKNFNDFKYNRFNPSVNEWLNSIYNFNRNNLNTIWSNKITFELISNYFNIKPNNAFIKKNKTLLLNRIFVSIPEIKSSLNNTNIFIYIFNKERIILNKKINKLKKFNKFSKSKKNEEIYNVYRPSNYINNISLHNKDLSNKNFIFNFIKIYINKLLENINLKANKKIIEVLRNKIYYDFFIKAMKKEIPNFFLFKRHLSHNLIKNEKFISLMKDNILNVDLIAKRKYYILYFYKCYITELYINKLKFNYINLFNLNKILHKIYNKRVYINIVNLKYLYLDNSLFISAIVRKIKERKSKVLKVLRKALLLPKIPEIDSMFLLNKKYIVKNENTIYNIINTNQYLNIKKIYISIYKSLKNIHTIGVRVEGKGRLTKRLTASRAVYKKSYKGSLKNIYSSYKGLSAVMSRGLKSNVDYKSLESGNRIGSYGVKTWNNTM